MVTKRPREHCAGPSAAALGLAPQEQCLPSHKREATSDVKSAPSQTTGARHLARVNRLFSGQPLLKKLQEDMLDRKQRLKREERPEGETS